MFIPWMPFLLRAPHLNTRRQSTTIREEGDTDIITSTTTAAAAEWITEVTGTATGAATTTGAGTEAAGAAAECEAGATAGRAGGPAGATSETITETTATAEGTTGETTGGTIEGTTGGTREETAVTGRSSGEIETTARNGKSSTPAATTITGNVVVAEVVAEGRIEAGESPGAGAKAVAAEGAEQRASSSKMSRRHHRRGPEVRARSGRAIRGSRTNNSQERHSIRLRRRPPTGVGEEGVEAAAGEKIAAAAAGVEVAEAAVEEAALAMVSEPIHIPLNLINYRLTLPLLFLNQPPSPSQVLSPRKTTNTITQSLRARSGSTGRPLPPHRLPRRLPRTATRRVRRRTTSPPAR